ncbi:hypothetical protein [Candidatus Liberibacter solanacearum]|uniref:hypothetical protein n=1 Tax=Candidatus Liberibacter solanacearum TaxID=556287 RepID=UPI00117C93CF|nr:hypothetical protein [Candidatus Liberibacter solanacearum]
MAVQGLAVSVPLQGLAAVQGENQMVLMMNKPKANQINTSQRLAFERFNIGLLHRSLSSARNQISTSRMAYLVILYFDLKVS